MESSAGTADPGPSDPSEIDPGDGRDFVTLELPETDEDFLNPERGYYASLDLLAPGSAATLRDRGFSLAIAQVQLDAYRYSDIDAAFLAALDAGFQRVREAGVKVVLRFKYNSSMAADAPKASMLRHIEQLTPLLRDNADVIAVLQAGFIGAWGEWHSSTNGLDNDADRGDILRALLAALPASRSVQVRTPMFKSRLVGPAVTGGDAYDGSARSRVGHHDDCFLASDSDFGTYDEPVADWKGYVAADTLYTPMGGETCNLYEPRTNCDSALAALSDHHWSYLNSEYNTDVINSWQAGGCGDEIRIRLGYRYGAVRVAFTTTVAPGGVLPLQIDVANRGFASLYNARPVYVVLTGPGGRHAVPLEVDPRRWKPGTTVSVVAKLRVPADLAPGSYSLSLWMPDADERLQADPRYAVRLDNQDAWDAAHGDNVLVDEVVVDAAAPGDRDPAARRFEAVR